MSKPQFKIGNVSYDPQGVIDLGKKKFIELHPHVENPGEVFDQVKAAHPDLKPTKQITGEGEAK